MISKFDELSLNARCLFVRMYNRKGPWFPVSVLHYDEFMDVPQTMQELLAAGFVSDPSSLATAEKLSQSKYKDDHNKGIAKFFQRSVISTASVHSSQQIDVHMSSKHSEVKITSSYSSVQQQQKQQQQQQHASVIYLDELSDDEHNECSVTDGDKDDDDDFVQIVCTSRPVSQFTSFRKHSSSQKIRETIETLPKIPTNPKSSPHQGQQQPKQEPKTGTDPAVPSTSDCSLNPMDMLEKVDPVLTFLQCMTVTQLRDVCVRVGLKNSSQKEALLIAMRKRIGGSVSRFQMMLKTIQSCVGACVCLVENGIGL